MTDSATTWVITDGKLGMVNQAMGLAEAVGFTTVSIDEGAGLPEAISMFLSQQTLSLLVRRGSRSVGILRLSDLFDELSRRILRDEAVSERT